MKFKNCLPWVFALGLLIACSEGMSETDTQNQSREKSQAVDNDHDGQDTSIVAEDLPRDPGTAYLYINSKKPGVQVTRSGLQFEILKVGQGETPGPRSTVVTHYHGQFIDGTVFDSSVDRGKPSVFPVNRVIKGWTEALAMMREGSKWRLVIPSRLAYGRKGIEGLVPPNSVLVFEIELIEVK